MALSAYEIEQAKRGWALMTKAADGKTYPVFTQSVSEKVRKQEKLNQIQKPWIALVQTHPGLWEILVGGREYKKSGGCVSVASGAYIALLLPKFMSIAQQKGFRRLGANAGPDFEHWKKHVQRTNQPIKECRIILPVHDSYLVASTM